MMIECGFAKIKKKMHENESFGQIFSNGHVYTVIKIWELASVIYCDYKNFGKQ